MQLYPFELNEESRNLYAIITPFGKYRYCRLPMGVKVSPDVAQEIESPLATLETILMRHQDYGFTINPLQCEMGHPGNRLARPLAHSIGPQAVAQEDQAPLRLTPPVRQSVGAVTFYRDLFRRCSHVLAPLTALIGTKKFDWTPECDRAFNAMNALLSEDALFRYPDPNLPFHIYTDASDLQLGSVIHQNDAPVAYFSRKLSDAQTRYSTIEKELLSVYETLRTFRPILLGAELHVHTDHGNLLFQHLNRHLVLYWRLLLESFTSTFHSTPRLIRYRAAPISLVEATRSEDNDNNDSGRFPLVEATRSEVCDTNDDSPTQPTDFPSLKRHAPSRCSLAEP
jgi:RNase H-like domain found in reverse transcriptase